MTHQIGDTVYANLGRYGRIDVRKGTVSKVTPTGRLNVSFTESDTRQFDLKGWEIGGDRWHKINLIDAETYERLHLRQRQQEAIGRVVDCIRSASFKDKATLDDFMAKLLPLVAAVEDAEPRAKIVELQELVK